MAKQVNQNIGHINCHICNSPAAVRKNKNEKFYYDCLNCGRITPSLDGGQESIISNAVIWGADGAPADTPRWIAEQWPYRKSLMDVNGVKPIGEKQIALPDEEPESSSDDDNDEIIHVGNVATPPPEKPSEKKNADADDGWLM